MTKKEKKKLPPFIRIDLRVSTRTPELYALLSKEDLYYRSKEAIRLMEIGLAVKNGRFLSAVQQQAVQPVPATEKPAVSTPVAAAPKPAVSIHSPQNEGSQDGNERYYTIPEGAGDQLNGLFETLNA